MVQWLRVHASAAGGAGLIPGWGLKIPKCPCSTAQKNYILRQEILKQNYLLVLASSLPSSMHSASALCINQTSPVAEIPAQP